MYESKWHCSLDVMSFAVTVFTDWHWITYFSNKSPTRCNKFPVYYPDIYLQLNTFRVFSHPSSGAQWCSSSLWFYLRIVVIAVPCSWSGRPRTQHGYHHDTKAKPEAATAVIELLTMGGKIPETCWAVDKRQDNKLENYCIWLVIYLNCTIMHGLTYLKFLTSVSGPWWKQTEGTVWLLFFGNKLSEWQCRDII